MDVKAYMAEDLDFIDSLIKDLQIHVKTWSSDKVLEKSGDMFDAFYKRFSLEDFLLRHVRPSKEMLVTLKQFLKVRSEFRESLENILTLHVDEPDFLAEIDRVHEAVLKHISYLKTDFDPNFFDKISAAQLADLSKDLEKRIKVLSFS